MFYISSVYIYIYLFIQQVVVATITLRYCKLMNLSGCCPSFQQSWVKPPSETELSYFLPVQETFQQAIIQCWSSRNLFMVRKQHLQNLVLWCLPLHKVKLEWQVLAVMLECQSQSVQAKNPEPTPFFRGVILLNPGSPKARWHCNICQSKFQPIQSARGRCTANASATHAFLPLQRIIGGPPNIDLNNEWIQSQYRTRVLIQPTALMGKGLQDSRNPQQTNSGAVFQLFSPRVPSPFKGHQIRAGGSWLSL